MACLQRYLNTLSKHVENVCNAFEYKTVIDYGCGSGINEIATEKIKINYQQEWESLVGRAL